MYNSKVVISTITWARNQGEKILLKETMELLSGKDYQVVTADGGSTEDFLTYLDSLPNFLVKRFNHPGVCEQAICSLKSARAYDADYVLYAESDKFLFFEQQLDNIIESVNTYRDWDILIPSRSDRSFQTFPEIQRKAETLINRLAGTMFGETGDYLYGPLLIKAQLIDLLNELDKDIGWGWRMFLIGNAISKGCKIKHIELDLPCPQQQRIETDKDKTYRLFQMQQNLEGILLSIHK